MKSVIKFIPFVVAAALMTNAAQAADGTINFQGYVADQTCTISVNGVVSPAVATVTLPTISAELLNAPGKVSGRTDFEITLSNCQGWWKSANAFFEAGADVEPISGQLINRGDATNVRLQLLDNVDGVGAPIKAGDSSQLTDSRNVYIGNGDGTAAGVLPYAVQYIATGIATAGSVQSTVTYSINYL